MDNLWIIYGYMDNLWIIYGQYMDKMDDIWIIKRLQMMMLISSHGNIPSGQVADSIVQGT